MNESRYWFLTGRYLSENITKEEQTELDNHLNSNKHYKEQFEDHIKIWKSFASAQKDIDFDSANSWLELKAMIDTSEKRKIIRHGHLNIWKYTAAAVIFIMLTIGIILIINKSSNTVSFITKLEKQSVVLPDGTKIWLNRNSQLSYNASFGKETRKVRLKGEAYFEVEHNPEKPFIIESNHTFTKVLGTKFNVSSYEKDSIICVSVVQGKVQFGISDSKEESVILTNNCTGTFLKKTEGLYKSTISDPNALAWRTNRLVFSNSSLSNVIDELEDLYNINIVVKSPEIYNCTFSGTFNNQSIDEIIKIMEYTLNLDFKKNSGSQFSVSGKSCSN